MAIQKVFYRKKAAKKTFFSKNMNVRSFAYGPEIWGEFKKWQKYFFEKRAAYHGGLVLSEQENIYGTDVTQQSNVLDKALAPLRLEGNILELREDRYVWINGQRSSFYAGTEVKAGALFYFLHKDKPVKGLAVIGKTNGEGMQLRLHKWVKDGLQQTPFMSVPLPPTMEASSHLLCLGKHVFLVHNSMLDYYYINLDEKVLERVAIGGDAENETFAWCKYVNPNIVTTGEGSIFWMSEVSVA